MSKKLKNPIEQFIADKDGTVDKHSPLFKGNEEFIAQMTELDTHHVIGINKAMEFDKYLRAHGMRNTIFTDYCKRFMVLMVSHDRKSRREYVEVHKAEIEQERNSGVPSTVRGLP